MDAFTVNWSGENNWWCPPPVLITRVLRHAEWCRASGSLVVPGWESAPYWLLLCPSGEGLATFVVDYLTLPMEVETFCPGRSGAVLFNGNAPNPAVFALHLDFSGNQKCYVHVLGTMLALQLMLLCLAVWGRCWASEVETR